MKVLYDKKCIGEPIELTPKEGIVGSLIDIVQKADLFRYGKVRYHPRVMNHLENQENGLYYYY